MSSLLIPGKLWSATSSKVLDNSDYLMELEDLKAGRSEISIPRDDGTFDRYYNHWLCFNQKDVSLNRIEIEYDGEKKFLPQLDIETPNLYYEISLEGDYGNDLEEAFSDWKYLLTDTPVVCVYAAYLQDLNEVNGKKNQFLILSRLKTINGLWNEGYFSDDELIQGSKINKKQINDYEITISKNLKTFESKINITKLGVQVFEDSGIGDSFYFGNEFDDPAHLKDFYPIRQITHNGFPDLVISKSTGEAHCCNSLMIFELGNQFRKIAEVDAKGSSIRIHDLDHDGIPEIEFYDGAIDELFSSYAESARGRIVFKFDGEKYELSQALTYKLPPSLKHQCKIEKLIQNSFVKQNYDLPYVFLKTMMDLSYSGHLNLAMKIAEEAWPIEKEGLIDFKNKFMDALSESSYWKFIQQE